MSSAVESSCFEPAANDGVIVGDHHPDRRGRDGHSGTSTCKVVPAPGTERTSSRPPASVTSPRRATSPKCPLARLFVASSASNPRPSSTRSRIAALSRCVTLRRTEEACAWSSVFRSPSCALRYSSRAAESGSGSSSSISRSTRSPRSLPREQVGHRRVERDLVEVGRVDVDDQRTQRPNAAAYRFGCVLDHLGIGVRTLRPFPSCGRRERVRDTGQVLHRAVVEIGRDLAALDVARFQRPVQQQLAFPQPHAQAARERPGDRDLHELQHQQRAERDRGEAAPQPIAVACDERVVVVGLEQQRLPRRRSDRQVDLEQLAVRAFVAVLRLRQVADVGVDRADVERAAFVGREPVRFADQAGLVGVEDLALSVPDLHPNERAVEHVAPHDTIQARDRRLRTREQTVGDCGLDETLRPDDRRGTGVGDRLPLTDPPAGDGGREADDHEQDHTDQCELTDLDGDNPPVGAPGTRGHVRHRPQRHAWSSRSRVPGRR